MKKKKPKLENLLLKLLSSITATLLLIFCGWLTQAGHASGPQVETSEAKTTEPVLFANQTQDDLSRTLLSAIKGAKESIVVMIYALTDKQVIQALKQKSLEGVDVKVICDAVASPYVERKLGKKVKTTKIAHKGIMHLKIVLIDGEQVWLGSANLTGDSLNMHGNLVISLKDHALASFINQKAESMRKSGNQTAFPAREFVVGEQRLEMWFLPDNKEASLRIKELIRSAKKTIRVAMFTWTRRDFANAILDAKLRGVDVEVALDRNSSQGASAPVATLLTRKGLHLLKNAGHGLLHHKFLYIDGKILVNGSTNWTKRAFSENDDCFIILHDLSKSQQEKMEKLWRIIKAESL